MKKKPPRKVGRYTVVKKRGTSLEVNELTTPRTSGKFKGVSIGRDKQGIFVGTHRARSKSYETLADIPKDKIAYIKSTG